MKKLDFDITKIICINLKAHNEQQLKAICLTYGISLDELLRAKLEGMTKIWLPDTPGYTVAELFGDDIQNVYFYPHWCPMTARTRKAILNIKPIKTPKMPKQQKVVEEKTTKEVVKTQKAVSNSTKNDIVLELDLILDKINSNGMSSLTKQELNFLKNFN